MDLDGLDDQVLVARCQEAPSPEARRDAFATLVGRYQERIFNLVYRRLDDREVALDVAQEVFLKVYRGLPRFQGDAQFYTWLFRIAMNETVSAHRKLERHRRPLSLDRALPDGQRAEDPPAPEAEFDPSAALERGDDRAMVQRAIAELEDDLAQPLVLRDIDGRGYQEIAHILQLPLGSVKSRIHRARQALKGRLSKVIERQA